MSPILPDQPELITSPLDPERLAEIRTRVEAVSLCPDAQANGREDGLHTWAGYAGTHLRCFLCRTTVSTDEWVADSAALLAEVARLDAELREFASRVNELESAVCDCEPVRENRDLWRPAFYQHEATCVVNAGGTR